MRDLPLDSKETQLIKILYDHMNEHVSSQVLGDYINVSDRTARKYIKNISQFLGEYGAKIDIKKGQGYKLVIDDPSRFNSIFNDISNNQKNNLDVLTITEPKDRERYLLNKIFLEGQILTVDEYAKELFVSNSTIMHTLQSIRKQLQAYELTLINDVNEGISIQGVELEKRRFILNYFFKSHPLDTFMNFTYDYLKESDISLESLFIIVLEECRNGKIQLSDYAMQNLVLHLALAIVRIKEGKTIEAFQSNQELDFSYEIDVAKQIISRAEDLEKIEFPEDEAKYIALHLNSKSNKDYEQDDLHSANFNVLQSQIFQALSTMKDSSNLEFSLDSMLVMGLEAHFEPLITRLKMGVQMKNPLFDEVYSRYTKEFEIIKYYFSQMPLLEGHEVDNHEWAYIVLHVFAAIERHKQKQQLNVIVICSTGMGSAQMLRSRLETEFGSSIRIIDVISYYQLDEQKLEDIDLIISTIDITTSFFTIPVIQVSVFLNEQDIRQIKHYIKDHNKAFNSTSQKRITESHSSRLFNEYFSEDRYFIVNQPISREDLLHQMVETLTDFQEESLVEDFIKQVELRERFGSLVFSENLAFPHPSVPLGVHSEIAVAVIKDGVEWDEEHKEIKFVVLMSPSKVSNKGLPKVTDFFVRFIGDEEAQRNLLEDPSFENFKALFIEQ